VASGGTAASVVEVRNEATGPAGDPEHSHFIEWSRLPEVQRPVIVAAFEGWNDAGDAATTAVGHLRDRLRAEAFAKIDPEEFFDFTSTRPIVHIEDGASRSVEWPLTEFCAVSRDRVGTDLITLLGSEPQLRWRTFCDEIISVAAVRDFAALTSSKLVNGKLHKEFQFADFVAAFGFMAQAALVAERMNHHPEWFNVYRTVRVDLATHDVSGISEGDFVLAEAMDKIASN